MAIRRYDFTATFNDKDEWDINPPFINTASSVYIRQIRGSRTIISIESGEQIFSFDSEKGLGFALPPFSKLRVQYRDRTATRVEELSLYVSDVPVGIQDNRLIVSEGSAPVPVSIQDQPVEVYFDASNAIPVDIQNESVPVVTPADTALEVTAGLGLYVYGRRADVPLDDLNVRVRNAPLGIYADNRIFDSSFVPIPDTGVNIFNLFTTSRPRVLFRVQSVQFRFDTNQRLQVQHGNGEVALFLAYGQTETDSNRREYLMRAKDILIVEDEDIEGGSVEWQTWETPGLPGSTNLFYYVRYVERDV